MADSNNTLSSYFDITVRQQLETQFKTSPHDKFFLFSSLPTFDAITGTQTSAKNYSLCPLMFTNTFNAFDPRIPGGQIGSLGTSKVIQQNSPGGGPKSFQIGSFAVITGDPNGADTDKNMKWTLAKKLFYPLLMAAKNGDETCKLLVDQFLVNDTSGGFHPPNSSPYKVIAQDINDVFTNFGESEFYDIPFGLLVVTLTKGNDFVSARFLEMCKLADQGPMTQAMLNNPSIVSGAQGVSGGYSREVPVQLNQLSLTTGVAQATFLDALFKYCGINTAQR